MKWTHNDLAADLARHVREKTGRIVWTDMQLGPVGSPRPDVYGIETSYTKFRPLAYEVKVAVSDFRRDITAGKWQTYLPFASGVIFAVPAGLVAKSALPEGCGLMERGTESWRTVKAPTLRHIESLPHAAWLKLFIDGLKREGVRRAEELAPKFTDDWLARRRIGHALGTEIQEILSNRAAASARYERETARIAELASEAAAQIQAHQAMVRERVQADAASMDTVRAELADALGLPATSSVHLIRRAAEEQASRLSQDGEIIALRSALRDARNALDRALPSKGIGCSGAPR